MSDEPSDFRHKLLEAQEMTPALRDAYLKELDAVFHETPTRRTRSLAVTLLVICLAVVGGEVRALFIYRGGGIAFYGGAVTMLAACALAAAWLVRDLRRAKVARKSAFKLADVFYAAAWVLTVIQLLHGLRAPSDPASTFGVLYVFVFAVVCSVWSLSNRVAAAELAAREQMLRIEYRLAELAERMRK